MTGKKQLFRRTGAILLLVVCVLGAFFHGYVRGFAFGLTPFYESLVTSPSRAPSFRFGRMEMMLLWDLSGWMLVAAALGILHRRFRQFATLYAATGAGCILLCLGITFLFLILNYSGISNFRHYGLHKTVDLLRMIEYPGYLLLGYGIYRTARLLAGSATEAPREKQLTLATVLLILLTLAGGAVSGCHAGSRHSANLISFGKDPSILRQVDNHPVLRESKLPDYANLFRIVPGMVVGLALATAGTIMLRRRYRRTSLVFAAAGSACMLLVLMGWILTPSFNSSFSLWLVLLGRFHASQIGLYLFGGGLMFFATSRILPSDDVHGLDTGRETPEPRVTGDH